MSKFVYDFYYQVIERLMKERDAEDRKREAAETAAHRFKVGNRHGARTSYRVAVRTKSRKISAKMLFLHIIVSDFQL